MAYEPDANWLELECYIHSRVTSGRIPRPVGLRLIDLLNNKESGKIHEILEFYETTDTNQQDQHDASHADYIRKSALEFIALSNLDLGRGVGATHTPKHYPFVRKSALRVFFQLTDFVLHGTLHLAKGQTVEDAINGHTQFLPLTDVTLARECNLYGTRPFVAVTKECVSKWTLQAAM